MSKTSKIITVDASILVKAATNKWGQKFSMEAIERDLCNGNVTVWWGGAPWYVSGWQHNYQALGGWTDVQLTPLYTAARDPKWADSAQYLHMVCGVKVPKLDMGWILRQAAQEQEFRVGAVADSAWYLWAANNKFRHGHYIYAGILDAPSILNEAASRQHRKQWSIAEAAQELWQMGARQDCLIFWTNADLFAALASALNLREKTADAASKVWDRGQAPQAWLMEAEPYEVMHLAEDEDYRVVAFVQADGYHFGVTGRIESEAVVRTYPFHIKTTSCSVGDVVIGLGLGVDLAEGQSESVAAVKDRSIIDVLVERERQREKHGKDKPNSFRELSDASASYGTGISQLYPRSWKIPKRTDDHRKALLRAAALACAALQAFDEYSHRFDE